MLTTFLAALVAVVFTLFFSAKGHIHEIRESLDEDWERLFEVHPSIVLPVKVALKQSNLKDAERYIMDVADPLSPNFGKHWSPQTVADTFAPAQETIDTVLKWLEKSGIDKSKIELSLGRHWASFDATVSEVEKLLDTKYYYFKHRSSGEYHIACDLYNLPTKLQDFIDFVSPTVQMHALNPFKPRIIKQKPDLTATGAVASKPNCGDSNTQGLTGLKRCAKYLTIECLRAIYNFPAGRFSHKNNSLGIAEFNSYLYRPDLQTFFKNLTRPRIPSNTYPEFVSVDGGKTFQQSGVKLTYNNIVESAIDVQLAYSIVYPQGLKLYEVGDGVERKPLNPFDLLLDALDASFCHYRGGNPPSDPKYPDPKKNGYKGRLECGSAPRSNVYSISYAQVEAKLSSLYKHRQCYEYMKMGLMGVSLLFSSGDTGVSSEATSNGGANTCLAKHSNKSLKDGKRFSPRFPSVCPYVTSVGGTVLLHTKASKTGTLPIYRGEKALTYPFKTNSPFLFSGGGFSNTFKLPAYQKEAVTHYLQKYAPPYGPDIFNRSGKARAYPDVAAFGYNLNIVYDNCTINGGGTSASAPIVASIVTLLNEERLHIGKGPIGFLNPVFYAYPEAFNDVTVGNNPGCGTKGFECAPGWDPVTGLGTPNFQRLKKVFLNLP